MNLKKLLSLLLAVAMMLALAACGGSAAPSGGESSPPAASDPSSSDPGSSEPAPPSGDGETYNIILNLHKGENASVQEKAYMEAVTEATGGRVTFEVYYANSLLKPAEVPEGLANGIIDMGVINVAEYPSIIPLTSYLLTMPFSGIQGDDYYTVTDQLLSEYPEIEAEFASGDMKLITYHYASSTNLFFAKDVDVHTPADLQGKQMIATSASVQTLISNAGGAPVSAGPPDFYSYLERSVTDGIVNHWGQVFNSALFEVCDTAVIFGADANAGITRDLNALVISPAKWDSLPADIQEAFISCADVYQTEAKAYMDELTTNGSAALENEGAKFIYLTDDEIAAWQEAFAPICNALLAELDGKGINATAIYERMLEINAGL